MLSFKTFLKEEAETEATGKLKHIDHAEDRPILYGGTKRGFSHAYDALMKAHNHTKSGGKSSDLTMKYDGSPSLVFGHHPETGKFFVASKSAFNKNPKINYTSADIAKNHGHAPGLMKKLQAALHHLKKVAPKTGVYQGDMMFSENDDEKEARKEKKGGKVSFNPNTINYTASGEEAARVKKAKVGIVVHQQYHGDTIDNMTADPHPDLHHFGSHPDVWMKGAEHDTKNVHYSDEDQKEFLDHLAKAKAIHDKHGKDMYKATEMHRGENGHLITYINSTVRTGEVPSAEGLAKHIQDKYAKMKALKTPAGQSRREAEMKSHLDYIKKNKKHYAHLLEMHHHLQAAKNVLVRNLEQHTGGLEHDIEGQHTGPEGFVVNHSGEPTKLVNREEFAKANLLRQNKFGKKPQEETTS
jgi:hypothetical protein